MLPKTLMYGAVFACGSLVLADLHHPGSRCPAARILALACASASADDEKDAKDKPALTGVWLQNGGETIVPDLKALADGKGGTIPADATLKWVKDVKGRPALKVQTKKDGTVILLDRIEFTNGVIEFDALGQSGPPQSNFPGFAFRVVDAKTYDAVYFRPFNFRAEDAERKAHAVQYISHPKYPWHVLRKDKPGQYEKPIVPAPDGDAWFHVRIVVERPKVRVYVNGGKEPSLAVHELSDRNGGGVGLSVAPGQGGYFANLKITPAVERQCRRTHLSFQATLFTCIRASPRRRSTSKPTGDHSAS